MIKRLPTMLASDANILSQEACFTIPLVSELLRCVYPYQECFITTPPQLSMACEKMMASNKACIMTYGTFNFLPSHIFLGFKDCIVLKWEVVLQLSMPQQSQNVRNIA